MPSKTDIKSWSLTIRVVVALLAFSYFAYFCTEVAFDYRRPQRLMLNTGTMAAAIFLVAFVWTMYEVTSRKEVAP